MRKTSRMRTAWLADGEITAATLERLRLTDKKALRDDALNARGG